jgi:hypothetical protein
MAIYSEKASDTLFARYLAGYQFSSNSCEASCRNSFADEAHLDGAVSTVLRGASLVLLQFHE